MNWKQLSAISTAAGTVVVAVTVIFGVTGLREAQSARRAQVLISLHARYHSPELQSFRRRLLLDELGDLRQLGAEDANRLALLMNELQFAAILLHRGLVPDVDIEALYQGAGTRVSGQGHRLRDGDAEGQARLPRRDRVGVCADWRTGERLYVPRPPEGAQVAPKAAQPLLDPVTSERPRPVSHAMGLVATGLFLDGIRIHRASLTPRGLRPPDPPCDASWAKFGRVSELRRRPPTASVVGRSCSASRAMLSSADKIAERDCGRDQNHIVIATAKVHWGTVRGPNLFGNGTSGQLLEVDLAGSFPGSVVLAYVGVAREMPSEENTY